MNLSVFLSAAALVMSPGGHGSLRPNGVLYAESGHVGGASSAMFALQDTAASVGLRVTVDAVAPPKVRKRKR